MEVVLDLLRYAGTAGAALIALVIVVMGAVVVRPVSATAGYAVIAAGAFRLFATCCLEAISIGADVAHIDAGSGVPWLYTLVTPIEHVVFWGGLAFAAYTVASATPAPPGAGAGQGA